MFLRRIQRKKNGKRHTYWALAESYRTAGGPRQRIVSYLGELKESEQSGWAQLSARLNGHGASAPSLFDVPEEVANDEPVLVKLSGVRLERLRDFGDVWLALWLWHLLGLDKLLADVMEDGREDVAWHVVAAILVLARFCEPSSELHIETTWYRRTALDDLLGARAEKVHTDRLYTGLDQLLPHKQTIEKHLKERLGSLFDLDYELLLYDVTSTYFEGQCRGNPLAKRGYSRDKRPDCLQVQGENSRAAKAFDVEIKRLERPQSKARLQITWTRKIKCADVVLPATSADGTSPREIRLRCVTEPDDEQKLLLGRLGLDLPRRLRSKDHATAQLAPQEDHL